MLRQVFGLCMACILALAAGGCPDVPISDNPKVSLSVDNETIAGNGGVATVTATLDSASMHPVDIALDFGGTGVSGLSYTRSATTITIPSYATKGSITIRGTGSSIYNPGAEVTVSIKSVTNGQADTAHDSVTVAITSDSVDSRPSVSLSLPSGTTTFDKKAGTIDVTATLSHLTAQEVTVNLTFAGTAASSTDYTRSAEQIVIAGGKSTGKITLTGANPSAFVNHKSVIVSIDTVTNASITTNKSGQEVTAYLKDTSVPLPMATLTLDKTTIPSNGGQAVLTCTLDKTIPVDATIDLARDVNASTGAYNVNYKITDRIGKNNWLLTIPANQPSASLTITGMQPTDYAGDVICVLDVADSANVDLSNSNTGPFRITVQDQHPAPQVTLSVAGSPISENKGVATVTATLVAPLPMDTTVGLSFTPGVTNGATLDSDYTVSAQAITIPKNTLSNSVQVTAIPNPAYTGDKTMAVKVTSVTVGTTKAVQNTLQQGTIAIVDAQSLPTVSLSLSSNLLYQSNGTAQVSATLSNPNAKDDVVANLTFSGTAVQGADKDYTASDTSITIPKGYTQGAITLRTVNNSTNRVGNTVIVSLGTISAGATAGTPSQVTATLTDVSVSLALTGSPIAENGGVATITATLNQAISSDVTINFGLGGTAVKDTDYTASDAKIVIPAGQTTGTLTLTGKENNTYDSPSKTINVSAQQVQNAAVVDASQFTVTITDDYAAAGVRWLADNKTKPGVTVTSTGLQYKVITTGTGPIPTLSDTVNAIYTGSLIDGTVFNDSQGQTVPFKMAELIAGFQEALLMMPQGSHWILYVPADLAYGATPKQGIPPNSVLIFDLTLDSIQTPP